MCDLQAFCGHCDFAVRGLPSLTQEPADSLSGFGRRDEDDGSIDAEQGNL